MCSSSVNVRTPQTPAPRGYTAEQTAQRGYRSVVQPAEMAATALSTQCTVQHTGQVCCDKGCCDEGNRSHHTSTFQQAATYTGPTTSQPYYYLSSSLSLPTAQRQPTSQAGGPLHHRGRLAELLFLMPAGWPSSLQC